MELQVKTLLGSSVPKVLSTEKITKQEILQVIWCKEVKVLECYATYLGGWGKIFLQHIILPSWIKCPACPTELNLLPISLQVRASIVKIY